jgi:hypothetical protein
MAVRLGDLTDLAFHVTCALVAPADEHLRELGDDVEHLVGVCSRHRRVGHVTIPWAS